MMRPSFFKINIKGIDQQKSGWRDRLPIPRLDETTLTHRMFGGYLRSQVKCTKCKHHSNTYDPFMDLSLEVSGNSVHSLHDALREFTRKETLDSDNKWKCSGCKKMVCATKQLTIFRPPLTLCIQMKRFSFTSGLGSYMHHQGYSHFSGKGMGMKHGGSKIQKAIEFPEILNLSLSDGRICEYELTGVVIHVGGSATSGHYTAYVKRPGKQGKSQWLHMDDSFVEKVSEKTVLRQKDAYVLFYCRTEVNLELPSPPPTTESIINMNHVHESISSEHNSKEKTQKLEQKMNSTTKLDQRVKTNPTPMFSKDVTPLLSKKTTESSSSDSASDSSSDGSDTTDRMTPGHETSKKQQVAAQTSSPINKAINKQKEFTTDAGTTKVKVLLQKIRRDTKHWRPKTGDSSDGADDTLLGTMSVSKWDDDVKAQNSIRNKDDSYRKAITEQNKVKEKDRKRKMYLDRWDSALDTGRSKKIKVKEQSSYDTSTPKENPFHRIQASLMSFKKGKPKGVALVSMKKRSKAD